MMEQDSDLRLDRHGFLGDFGAWNPDWANTVAELDRLHLDDDHWAVIDFTRRFYSEYRIPPCARIICQEVGSKINPYRFTRKSLTRLFPDGGCRQACRLAGLPEFYCHAC